MIVTSIELDRLNDFFQEAIVVLKLRLGRCLDQRAMQSHVPLLKFL